MFAIIWVVVGLLIAFYGLFQLGRTGNIDYIGCLFIAIMWPIVLLAAVVASPFVGVYFLGRFVRFLKE